MGLLRNAIAFVPTATEIGRKPFDLRGLGALLCGRYWAPVITCDRSDHR